MSIETDKYIELALKYKSQITIASSLLVFLLSFVAGRMTAVCPPKSEVCKAEIILIESLKQELSRKDNDCKKLLREEQDKAEKDCVKRIKEAQKGTKTTSQIVSCEEAKAIMPQCKKQGRW
jgi:hypothetical protein